MDLKQERSLWGALLAVKALYPNAGQWNAEIIPALVRLFSEYRNDIDLRHIAFPADWQNRLYMVNGGDDIISRDKLVYVEVELTA